MQNVIAVLTPEALEQEGLKTILGRYVSRTQDDYGLVVRFSCSSIDEHDLDFARQNAVFCLAQAALSNIHAYSQARSVEIAVEKEGDRLRLRIADDGNGFDIDKVKQGFYRSEMENFEAMRDRVTLVGGTLRIESHPGEGTLLEIDIPLGAAAPS
jgi:signal transduction histidine kinase